MRKTCPETESADRLRSKHRTCEDARIDFQTVASSLRGWIVAGMLALPFASAADPPNVILIVTDDQRPDTIAAHGNAVIRTPELDQLVREGTSFLRATCSNPICTPSRAEIISGSTGFRNGVTDFGGRFAQGAPLMAEWFRVAGYQTVYSGKWHNDGRPGNRGYTECRGLYSGGGGRWAKPQHDFAGRPVTGYRGWIFQENDGQKYPDRGVGLTADISTKIADAAIDAIRNKGDGPLFLHVNFTAPHDPLLIHPGWEDAYTAVDTLLPPNYLPQHPFDHGNFDGRDERLFGWPRTKLEVRTELAAYYAVISDVSRQVGRIRTALRQQQIEKNSIVVFTSDHGLAVGSHGLRGKQNMYDHTIGVPLILQGPGVPRDRRVNAQCYLRDLFPTLCDLAGIAGPGKQIDGRSLEPVLKGVKTEVHPFIYGYFRKSQRMIRTPRYKLIDYPLADRRQLFDLQDDPHERVNLISRGEHQQLAEDLMNQLNDWFSKQQRQQAVIESGR